MISVGIGFVLGFAACYVVHHPDVIGKAIAAVVNMFGRK